MILSDGFRPICPFLAKRYLMHKGAVLTKGVPMSPSGREKRAIDRFAAVSAVACRVTGGMSLGRAIAEVTKLPFFGLNGHPLAMSRASLYRWCHHFRTKKFDGLMDKERPKEAVSRVLPPAFVDFMVHEKDVDPDASLPEIIRRAEIDEVIAKNSLSRSSVWRTAKRLNLPIFAEKDSRYDDQRRFEHEHRMRIVLCDGKHFRVGATQVKRVVFTYLDDATRKVLAAVVGPAEDRALFLRGLMKVIRRAGLMEGIYLDRGPGFRAHDSALVCGRLGIALILGRARYPPGHGKIEKFNQTCGNDLLRGLSNDLTLDPSCEGLALRIEHYHTHLYNPREHGSLGRLSPDERWDQDEHELSTVTDLRKVEDHFIVTESRKVSRDNIVLLDSRPYEMPVGYRGRNVQVFRHFLEDRFTVLHEGRHLTLHQVDLHANARDHRARREAGKEKMPTQKIRTAAQRAFDKDHASVVSPDGDFYDQE